MKHAFFRHSIATLALMGVLSGLVASADQIHFHDGTVLDGKIYRATGELITVKQGWRDKIDIKRITLANRHDVIHTKDGVFTGEIVYMDKFKIDLMTDMGMKRITRWFVDDISIADPGFQPAVDHIVDSKPEPAFRPVNFQPEPARVDPLKPVVRRPSEELGSY